MNIESKLSEIEYYLKSNDLELARRRTLDSAFDTNNESIINETIKWSSLKNKDDNWINNGAELLTKIKDNLLTKNFDSNRSDLISASQITKTYGNAGFKLHPIDMKIKYGEILGVVGENGNGKTTLLRCLGGQLEINSGVIHYYFDKNNSEIDYYKIKQEVAFIPQRIPRWYGKLKDNLHFSATIEGLFGKENELAVNYILERMGLVEYADFTWDQISSGYKTRFEIARVLLQRPKLLILDEPLANLDINAQQTLLTDLKFIAKSHLHPMGVILSSQQLHEVEKIADNVIFIKKGQYIFSTNTVSETDSTVQIFELECTLQRKELEDLMTQLDSQIGVKYNGGYFTLESPQKNIEEILHFLFSNKVKITYFRDITNSTKKYFN